MVAAATQPQPSNPTQGSQLAYGSILLVALAAFAGGLDAVNFGAMQSFPGFQDQWCVGHFGTESTCHGEKAAINKDWQDNFIRWGSMLLAVGGILGSAIAGPYSARTWGRRGGISAASACTIVACSVCSLATSQPVFLVGRLILGLGVGSATFCAPLYIIEVCPSQHRGAAGSLVGLFVMVGGFTATLLCLVTQNWQVVMCFPGMPAAILLWAVWLIPESPRYVMQKHGYEAGLVCLQKHRLGAQVEDRMAVTEEAVAMLKQIEPHQYKQTKPQSPRSSAILSSTGSLTWRRVLSDRNLTYRLLVATGTTMASQTAGITAIVQYSGTVFEAAVPALPSTTVNCIFMSVMVVGAAGGVYAMDSAWGGRRRTLLVSSVVMTVAMALIGCTLLFGWNPMLVVVLLCVYGLAYMLSWNPLSTLYPSEIFANNDEREMGISLSITTQHVFVLLVAFTTPMLYTWSFGGMFLVYAGFNAVNTVFGYCCIKETRGVPMEDIPALFPCFKSGSDDQAEGTDVGVLVVAQTTEMFAMV